MLFQTILFYLFAAVLIGAALGVVFSRNPVHSIMFLVLAFFQSAMLWLMAEAEFLAIVLVLVYVGAVMVLFLFVVMMLDVDFAEMKQGFLEYMPVGALVGCVLLAEILFFIGAAALSPEMAAQPVVPIPDASEISNVEAIGRVLYTDYIFFFQLSGLVLLVAMVGAIVLTLRHKEGVKRQDIGAQVARTPAASVELRKVDSGKGI